MTFIRQLRPVCCTLFALTLAPQIQAAELSDGLQAQVIEWRRDLHQHPELGNSETRTAGIVAAHLKALGLEVHEGIAVTGVIGYLKGGKPGPFLALRADMDALPVTEQTDLPFASRITTQFRGEQVGVMHACGHDTHVAMLMGLAQVLAEQRETLPGSILFIFQPAEEGSPDGDQAGAQRMLAEGLFSDRYHGKPDAVFGMHVRSLLNTGQIGLRSGPALASSDTFSIQVIGTQTHGSRPWHGVDPIVVGSEIVLNLQQIVSRELDISALPTVVTIGQFKSGIRQNIIPDEAFLLGTIRSFDPVQRKQVIEAIERRATGVAAAANAQAIFSLKPNGYVVTVNNPELVSRMKPLLATTEGVTEVVDMALITGAEDFSFYAREVPGLFFFVGVTPPGRDPEQAPGNHSPRFVVDEAGLPIGMRAMLRVTLAYLNGE
ncbi:MAG: amidohydrolase [Xanthomonadales bacterium]|nr:amidohydrolase [Xanthomonadales bacterium]